MKTSGLLTAVPRDSVALIRETETSRVVTSLALFGQRHALMIRHQNEHYTLRLTRAGKLILTK
jgi:hemin uptake protein HemP